MALFPINADKNVGPAYYKKLLDNQLLVSAIFPTLQGEGLFAGMPCTFLRLAGCNLGAKQQAGCYFCDTYFSVNTATCLSFEMILAQIVSYGSPRLCTQEHSTVVITGGEPTLQPALGRFLVFLEHSGYFTHIESNGFALPSPMPEHTWLTVSPKAVGRRYHPIPTEVEDRVDQLKFIVSADPESPYHNVPSWANDLVQRRGIQLWVSPMNTYLRPPIPGEGVVSFWEPGLLDAEQNRRNHEYAAKLALANGYRLTLQAHLYTSLP